jgi:hypothetical protein
MPTGGTIVAIAASQTTIAASRALEAKVAACKEIITSYNPQEASVDAMRQYANCVNTLYPQSMSFEVIIGLKILFLSAFIGTVVGLGMAFKNRRDLTWDDWVLMAVTGYLLGAASLCFISSLVYGIYWVFAC